LEGGGGEVNLGLDNFLEHLLLVLEGRSELTFYLSQSTILDTFHSVFYLVDDENADDFFFLKEYDRRIRGGFKLPLYKLL
jgi:hypothetical protein